MDTAPPKSVPIVWVPTKSGAGQDWIDAYVLTQPSAYG